MLVGRLLGAAIGSKVSAKSMLTVVSGVGLLLTLGAMFLPAVAVNLPVFNGSEGFGLVNVPVNAALLVLIGLCTSIMWGGIFNLAVEGLGKYTEKASGIFMALVCGGGILPLLQNAIVDVTDGGMGYLTSYWVIVVALAYLLYYAHCGFEECQQGHSRNGINISGRFRPALSGPDGFFLRAGFFIPVRSYEKQGVPSGHPAFFSEPLRIISSPCGSYASP